MADRKRRRASATAAGKSKKKSKRAAPPISSLPTDVLSSILRRLPLPDFVRCAAVSSTWNSLISNLRNPNPTNELPWLMLPRTKADQINSAATFYSLSHHQEFSINLPSRWARCITSSSGWLVIADHLSNLHILNPLTGIRIPLPPSETLWDVEPSAEPGRHLYYIGDPKPWNISTRKLISYFIHKAIVVWTSDSTYTIFLIHGFDQINLSFARECDWEWNALAFFDRGPHFEDILYYKAKFCVLRENGAVEAYDLSSPSPPASPVSAAAVSVTLAGARAVVPKEEFCHRSSYLVESPGGDLLQVLEDWELRGGLCGQRRAVGFWVFKLVPDGDAGSQWVAMSSLGDCALFLGASNSVAISTREFPSLKRNCIYYCDDDADNRYKSLDVGVFDLESRSFGPCYPHEFKANWPLPMWFAPNLSKQGAGISECLPLLLLACE